MRPTAVLLAAMLYSTLSVGAALSAGQTAEESPLDPLRQLAERHRTENHARWTLTDSELELASRLNAMRSQLSLSDLEVDDLVIWATELGHASATYFGRSSFRQLLAVIHRSPGDPPAHAGEDQGTAFETDEAGRFEVAFSIPRPRKKHDRVVFYVKNRDDPRYHIAASVVLP